MRKDELLEKLELPDAFEDYTPMKESVLGGWHSDSNVFGFLIENAKPGLIIEVGSFVGFSAITMAEHVKRLGLECTILCIDTWLGSLEYWRDRQSRSDANLYFKHGHPQWYWSFLTNVKASKHEDTIIPLPLPSLIAARLLKEIGVKAELVYIDGSHDEKDVYDDMVEYWHIVKKGGAMFGDDWQWDSVQKAVERFAEVYKVTIQHDAINWVVEK